MNSHAERWVRSVKEECLSKLILFGESSLRRALQQHVVHYHEERNHQGKEIGILFPSQRRQEEKRERRGVGSDWATCCSITRERRRKGCRDSRFVCTYIKDACSLTQGKDLPSLIYHEPAPEVRFVRWTAAGRVF